MKPLVKITDVTFGYAGVTILSGINLVINKGDYVLITGGNGSGKSTLIKLILGLIKPVKGEIKMSDPKLVEKSVGYVSQSINIDKDFPITVKELILLECKVSKNLCKLSPQVHLAVFNAENLVDKKIGELSGGELQKVLISRALVTDPDILILDEPTNNLDKLAQKNLHNLLKKLNKQGKTIIQVTHSSFEAVCDFNNTICLELVDGNLIREKKND